MLKGKKLQQALALLEQAYPDAKPQLDFASPFELLIATILSAQCTDKRVNLCTKELFPKADTPQAICDLGEEGLIPYIRACGLYQTKAKNIIAACGILCQKYEGQVPQTRQELMALPGVGRKTANVVLSNAFGVPAIAVDTHVFRVTNRIGLACAKDVAHTEEQLMKNIPREKWSAAHHWLIYHGRQVCAAQKPKCTACPLQDICEYKKGK